MTTRHWRADSTTVRAVGPSGTCCALGDHGSRPGLWREIFLLILTVRKQTLGLRAYAKEKVYSPAWILRDTRSNVKLDLETCGVHEAATVVVPCGFRETFQHWAPRSFELKHAPHVGNVLILLAGSVDASRSAGGTEASLRFCRTVDLSKNVATCCPAVSGSPTPRTRREYASGPMMKSKSSNQRERREGTVRSSA